MQTVTPGASHLEVTPIAYGTWQFGGDWESVDEEAAVAGLVREGLTRHVGVSNYSTDQITEFAAVLPAETVQPPYHLFRRDIEADLLPYASTPRQPDGTRVRRPPPGGRRADALGPPARRRGGCPGGERARARGRLADPRGSPPARP